MIYGIGIDLVEIDRVERMLAQHGNRFSERVLAQSEQEAFSACVRPAFFLANRFAAKEALSKALGTGLRYPVTLHSISVRSEASGRPQLAFHGALPAYLEGCGVARAHLSLTHERGMACAMVVLETDG